MEIFVPTGRRLRPIISKPDGQIHEHPVHNGRAVKQGGFSFTVLFKFALGGMGKELVTPDRLIDCLFIFH